MKGIIETSVYLVIFALVCFFSIDFIRINQRVSDAGEISQYIENYILKHIVGIFLIVNYQRKLEIRSFMC